ncbi:hypothetical protein [Sphingosinicella sp. YJ22]|uniref:hypothetical protein n=1 Tax=Sphingosinicella sp. YJ22 TaxID=1104780 RepID=UPI00140832E4|nr:hypothetical protein [Sphingosinicella sp. YJ22]
MSRLLIAATAVLPLVLTGCARSGDIFEGGILTTYSPCPPAAIPAPAGDITLFNPADSRDSTAIDVVATISNVRASCNAQGDRLVTNASFEVFAQRRDNRGARDVVLPYFATVVQGGQNVVAKRTGNVLLRFADGQYRASAAATAQSSVSAAAATLPANIQQQITRRRRAGDPNAALDPMSDPAVRAAVEQARYELLVGFELTADQLRYNATR